MHCETRWPSVFGRREVTVSNGVFTQAVSVSAVRCDEPVQTHYFIAQLRTNAFDQHLTMLPRPRITSWFKKLDKCNRQWCMKGECRS
jgi:hypothetical protein